MEPLIAILQDSDLNVRSAAAKMLGKIGDARAVESLLATLKDSECKCAHGCRGGTGTDWRRAQWSRSLPYYRIAT